MKLNSFSLVLAGTVLFFFGGLINGWGGDERLWILVRLVTGICFFSAFALALVNKRFRPEQMVFVYVFLILLVYVGMISAPNFMRTYGMMGFRSALAGDFVSYGFLALGVTLLSFRYRETELFFKALLVASLALFVLLLPQLDPAWVGQAATRQEAGLAMGDDRGAYHIQLGLAVLFCVLFLASFAFKLSFIWRCAAAGSLAFVLIVAFYYAKRSTLIDVGIVLILFLCVHGMLSPLFGGVRRLQIFSYGALALAALAAGAYIFGDNIMVVAERVVMRFEELLFAGGVEGHGRVREAQVAWQTAPLHHRILGAGSLHYITSAATGNMTNSLHIGWAHLYFRAGPPLVLFFVLILASNLWRAFRDRRRPSFLVGATLPVFIALAMSHSTVFGSLFSSFAVVLALFLSPALYSLESRAFTHGRSPRGAAVSERPAPPGYHARPGRPPFGPPPGHVGKPGFASPYINR